MSATKKPRHNVTRSQHRQATARRRRELAATRRPPATAPAAVGTPGRRRGATIAAVVALGAIVAGTVAFAVTRGSDTAPDVTLNGVLVAASAPEQTMAAPAGTYRVTYRVEMMSGASLLEQEVLVRRPFDLRYRFGDPGALDSPILERVQTAAYTTTVENGAVRAEASAGSLPVAANRYDVTLADLVDRGFYERRERRRVLDTECTVYRTGTVMESFVVNRATDSVHADLCISDDGLVLEEVSVTDGKADMRVVATAIERDPELTDADFPVSTDAAAILSGGIASTDLAPDVAPVSPYWRFGSGPTGWAHTGRRQIDVTRSDDGSAGPLVARTSFVDTYTRGRDLLVVSQGPAGTEPEAVSTTQAVDVDVNGVGPAKVVLGANGATLVIEKDGRFLHLQGTMSIDELVGFASSLRTG